MKSRKSAIAIAITIMVACATPDAPTSLAKKGMLVAAHDQDLDGKPDLIVDDATLGSSWVMYNELIPPGCTAEEGEVIPGEHRTLRFTVNTPNIGTADVFVGDPNAHFNPDGDDNTADGDGLFEFASCHNHFHFRHYATYELLPINPDGTLGEAVVAAKRGFCMIDISPYRNQNASPKAWVYRSCGRPRIGGLPAIPGNQGVSVGYADQYNKHLAGQFFVVDGLAGRFVIRIHVNPPFVPQSGEPCPHRDPAGSCHMLEESDYSNNVGQVVITIPEGRAGKKGWGPGGGEELDPSIYELDQDALKMGQKVKHGSH